MSNATMRARRDQDNLVVISALRTLDGRLRAKFGDRYVRVLLFGSRARGDYGPESDADVAVVFRERVDDQWALTKSILEDTYDILLATGLYIEPHLIDETALKRPEASPHPDLAREIERDGIPL